MSLAVRADALTAIPNPYVFPPSSRFEGVDGSWSTFTINVGDDGHGNTGQNFHIFPSTSATATYIPGATNNFCGNQSDPDACWESRGIQVYRGSQQNGFNTQAASAWNQLGSYNLGLDTTTFGYGDNDSAIWGTDNVGIGDASTDSQTLPAQPVALFYNATYWLGLFGLSTVPTNIDGSAYPTFIDSLFKSLDDKNQSLIPSMSYGYAAGASYANARKGQVGSLIFGGYDASLFDTSRTVQISFPGGVGGEDVSLSAAVTSVVTDDGNTVRTLDNSRFSILIDSTLPYLWLPGNICDQLEDIYDITEGPNGLYNVSTAHYQQHFATNITFSIANNVNSMEKVDIVLPYAALYHTAKYPVVRSDTQYLAFRRSPNNNYVLGRAFLQHAYLVVDYERRYWSVAPTIIADPLPSPNITRILSPAIQTPEPTPIAKDKLSGGAIAGIVVATLAFALVLALAIFYFRKAQQKKQKLLAQQQPLPPEKDIYEHPGSPAPAYGSASIANSTNKNRHTYDSQLSQEMPDSSRSASAQGFYGGHHRHSESGSNITELVGSPAPGYSDAKSPGGPGGSAATAADSYFKHGPGVVDPAPLAELPGDHGISEAPLRRPRGARKRSAGSNGKVQSPDADRPLPIHEVEEGDHASPPPAAGPDGLLAEPRPGEDNHDAQSSDESDASKGSSEDSRVAVGSADAERDSADGISPAPPPPTTTAHTDPGSDAVAKEMNP
ncbi:acid protease [Pseudovirgaria hyperparasitica]|uniref:Acid protease n=1 Tax=Pseudovirgaria hyperparasitica TaxID=470096 RepID=A0A6A6VYJ5_9PEZI|nr:acid protease [Pseudovirgaria hyperparasitica]KAF2754377.1 acid protease [Pseudovirgaria hyperparasitica]